MAIRHRNTVSSTAQDKPLTAAQTKVLMRNKWFPLIAEYAEISGVPVSKLLGEALEDFVTCTLRARAEGMRDRVLKSQRTEARVAKKAAEKKAIDECLASLEKDMSPA